jgi:cytochrome c oxidase subunit II
VALMALPVFPIEASAQAVDTDRILLGLILLSAFILIVVFGLIFIFAFRYRNGSPAKRGELPGWTERGFEIGWTSATLFLALFIAWWVGASRLGSLAPAGGALQIHVVAKQWMWKTQHPNGAREINALHVPIGEPVTLLMTSQDVIHSFFVPAFRIKQDVLPGRYTQTWFKATRLGTYHLFCTQLCGIEHSRMVGEIVVMRADDYGKWVAAQPMADTIAAQGEALFRSLGCSGCHVGSNVHAPPLAGIYGKPVHLSDGRTVAADDAYIRDSILQPGRDIVAGYENIMPSFAGDIGDDEILALTAYIRSLRDRKEMLR